MKIKKLIIKNFRSIGPEGVEISIDTNITALIGKNNVGKSNILRAIELVLGTSWPRESFFSLEDFYRKNINNDISIEVYFENYIQFPIKIAWYEHNTKIYGFKLEYKTYKRDCSGGKKGELHLEYNCIKEDGSIVLVPTEPPKKGKGLVYNSPLKVRKQIKELCNTTFFVPADRNIFSVSPSNSRSILGLLIKKVRENFLDSNNKIAIDQELADVLDIGTEIPRKELFEKFLEKANDTLKTDELTTLLSTIEHYLVEQIGKHESEGISFDFKVQDSWNQYKYISLSLEHNGLMLPADRLGSGFQSLIVIAVFRAYLRISSRDAIFLLEEPEMFLHTHAKKYFYSILRKLAEEDTQIIYTTHATEFVDLLNHKDVKRVVKDEDKTLVFPEEPDDLDFSDDEIIKINTAINNERAELFFSEVVLLVEGNTEKLVFNFLMRLKGIDPNLFNISIIETSGKGSMYRYIMLLNNLSIPYIVVCDSDIMELKGSEKKEKEIIGNNKKSKEKNDQIIELMEDEDNLIMMEPYFEVVAGINSDKTHKKDSKPINALTYFQKLGTYEDINISLSEVVKPIEILINKGYVDISE